MRSRVVEFDSARPAGRGHVPPGLAGGQELVAEPHAHLVIELVAEAGKGLRRPDHIRNVSMQRYIANRGVVDVQDAADSACADAPIGHKPRLERKIEHRVAQYRHVPHARIGVRRSRDRLDRVVDYSGLELPAEKSAELVTARDAYAKAGIVFDLQTRGRAQEFLDVRFMRQSGADAAAEINSRVRRLGLRDRKHRQPNHRPAHAQPSRVTNMFSHKRTFRSLFALRAPTGSIEVHYLALSLPVISIRLMSRPIEGWLWLRTQLGFWLPERGLSPSRSGGAHAGALDSSVTNCARGHAAEWGVPRLAQPRFPMGCHKLARTLFQIVSRILPSL